jgi:hypothetical protein
MRNDGASTVTSNRGFASMDKDKQRESPARTEKACRMGSAAFPRTMNSRLLAASEVTSEVIGRAEILPTLQTRQ